MTSYSYRGRDDGEKIGRKGFTGFRGNLIKVTVGKPEFKQKIESIKKLKEEAVIEILKEYYH